MRNSKAVGDETEARVIHELIASGYSVSIPFGDNDRYDLVVDDDGSLYRVQCKTAWSHTDGAFRFNTHSQTTNDGEYEERPYTGSIDAFVVRHPHREPLYWVDVNEAPEQKMDLRFDADINHPSIHWADEYAFTDEIP